MGGNVFPRAVRAILLMALLGGCKSFNPISLASSTSTASSTAMVTIHPENPGRSIPPDFSGLSFEAIELAQGSFDPRNVEFVNLVRNLGHGTLRIGGVSLDKRVYWSQSNLLSHTPPDVLVTGSSLDGLFGFAKMTGWPVSLGLSLGQDDPSAAAEEAQYAITKGDKSLLALEIGNEPNLFAQNAFRSKYDYADFRIEFEAYVHAIRLRAPDAPIAGPEVCCDSGVNWFPRYINNERPVLSFATFHLYPLSGDRKLPVTSERFPTLDRLLSASLMAASMDKVDALMQSAQAQQIPLWIDETNTVNNGGAVGVSNVFASALWAINYLYNLAEHGVQGVNLHNQLNCPSQSYSPICRAGSTFTARPVYYGMLLFSQANRGKLVPLDIQTSLNIDAHAMLGEDGKLRVTLINNDPAQTVEIIVRAGGNYTKGQVMRLTAPSLGSLSSITFAGSAVNSDGTWSPGTIETVGLEADGFHILLSRGSAALVIIE